VINIKRIAKKGHWLLFIYVCFSFLKDITSAVNISVKILSGLCLLAGLFVVLVIEKRMVKE